MAGISFDGMSLKQAKKALEADPTVGNVAAFQAYINGGGKSGSLSQNSRDKALEFSRQVWARANGGSDGSGGGPTPSPSGPSTPPPSPPPTPETPPAPPTPEAPVSGSPPPTGSENVNPNALTKEKIEQANDIIKDYSKQTHDRLSTERQGFITDEVKKTTDARIRRLDNISGEYGTRARFTSARNRLGKEYDRIARDYSKDITDLYREFKRATPDGDFEAELGRANSEWGKRKFAIDQKYAGGLQQGEEQVTQAFRDLTAIEGNGKSAITGKYKKDGVLGSALAGRSSQMSEVVNEAYGNFNQVVIDGADGAQQTYQTMTVTRNIANANGSGKSEASLMARLVGEDGKMGSWGVVGEGDLQRRIALGERTGLSDEIIEQIGKDLKLGSEEGFSRIASDTQGATFVRESVHNLNKASDYVQTRSGLNAIINNPGSAAESNIRQEAARIAKTGAAEGSGILSQLASSAAKHPGIAAAIAVGGFALASKALDKRREYD